MPMSDCFMFVSVGYPVLGHIYGLDINLVAVFIGAIVASIITALIYNLSEGN